MITAACPSDQGVNYHKMKIHGNHKILKQKCYISTNGDKKYQLKPIKFE